jgi:transcriptional regulator with XRE-family HTH domain
MNNSTSADSPVRVFGAMLTHYRSQAQMTQEQLAAKLYVSGSLVSKVEAGTRAPSEELARAADAALDCKGALVSLYAILAGHLRNGVYPGWFADWPRVEARARRLRSYQPFVVPGLLQTERYARAVLSTRVGATPEELDEAVAARMERQRILTPEWSTDPPELWVILDEAVLRRPVGGTAVMAEQVRKLAERRPGVVVQVIPFGAGAHEGMRGGAFVIAEMDEGAVAYQDSASSGQIITDPGEVAALALTWDTLGLEALPRAASTGLIREAAQHE